MSSAPDTPDEPKPRFGKIYDDAFCERAIEMGRAGQTPAEWAAEFGVAAVTLYKWKARYPDFAEAYDIGATAFRAFLEREAMKGINAGRQFNTGVLEKLGKVYFRGVYDAAPPPPPGEGKSGVPDAETLGSMTLEEIEAKEREILDRINGLRAAMAEAKAKARMRDEA